jgi:Esterase-like activity of phytase
MLQTPTFQDGAQTSAFTRLLAYDVSNPDERRPKLVGEWAVPLPLTNKGKTLGASEIHFVKKNVFLALTRDGDGRGGSDTKSKYK